MDGTATNKRKHLLSHADPDDRPTFEEMDDLLKENGITYNTISEEIQLPTQEKENPKASNKTRRTQNTTNWNNLIIPPWNEQNVENKIHKDDERMREIQSSLAKAKESTQRIKRRLNSLATKHYHMMIRHDAPTNNLKEVTKKLMKTPRTGPKAISMVLEDALNPRDEEGNLVWRFAKSNKERLLGSQQQHANWTGTGGEEKAIHYRENKKDEEGRTDNVVVNSKLPPPNDQEIADLLPDGGSRVPPEDIQKFREAHNPRLAKIFDIPEETNTHFMYPFVCTQEDKTIEFDKVREEFYRTAASIPGKARHKGFTLSVIGRAPMELIEYWIKGCFYILALRIGPTVAKELSRLPIPKEGKPNESRPLSLVEWLSVSAVGARQTCGDCCLLQLPREAVIVVYFRRRGKLGP